MITFPDDDNGDVLHRMQEGGDDLSKPRDIDFAFVFDEKHQALSFARGVRDDHGLAAEASSYDERQMWQTIVTKHMVPTYADITALEQELSTLAVSHGGEPDGWGCFQVSAG